MAGKKLLVQNVYVNADETNDKVKSGWYGPSYDQPDAETAKSITNPEVWGDKDDLPEEPVLDPTAPQTQQVTG